MVQKCLYLQGMFGNLEQVQQARGRNHVSYEVCPYGIDLPSSMNMTEEKVRYVCQVLNEALQERLRAVS